MVALARYQSEPTHDPESNEAVLLGQIERVEAVLTQLGTVHERNFANREKEILQGLASSDSFEQAQKLLGELLGFDAGKVESDGSPDPWWIADNFCIVFEDHAGALKESAIDVTKARQVASHPAWMRTNVEASAKAEILSVLVTPVSKVKKGAVSHLDKVCLWSLPDFREWAKNALVVIRELRKTFVEPGDLVWRASAVEAFEQNKLDACGLFEQLRVKSAASLLEAVN
ncbi:MAG: hypothetical protein ABI167_02160 [Nitrosospira sp.]